MTPHVGPCAIHSSCAFFFLKLHFDYQNIFIGFLILVQNINFSKLSFPFLLDDLRGESLVKTLKSKDVGKPSLTLLSETSLAAELGFEAL